MEAQFAALEETLLVEQFKNTQLQLELENLKTPTSDSKDDSEVEAKLPKKVAPEKTVPTKRKLSENMNSSDSSDWTSSDEDEIKPKAKSVTVQKEVPKPNESSSDDSSTDDSCFDSSSEDEKPAGKTPAKKAVPVKKVAPKPKESSSEDSSSLWSSEDSSSEDEARVFAEGEQNNFFFS